jgi:opacity protein-like surface antigen
LSKFGFALTAGVNVELTGNLLFFGEGNYTLASKTIQYPLYLGEDLKINLGGFIFNFGLKFAFQ